MMTKTVEGSPMLIARGLRGCASAVVLSFCLTRSTSWAADDQLPTPAGQPTSEIQSLIGQLGDESYATREAATEKLLAFGLPTLPWVEAGAKHPDREIRYRCERLRVMLREADLQKRLEDFAADTTGEKDHRLPGWDRFAQLHGEGPESRNLFVEMFRAEPDILKSMPSDPTAPRDQKKAADLVAARVFQLQQSLRSQQSLSLGTVAALLFAATEKDVGLPEHPQQIIYSFCHQQCVREAIAGSKKDVIRSLLAKYATRGEAGTAQGLSLAMIYDLEEGLLLARKLLESRGAGQPHLLQMALLAISKMGTADDLSEVEALLGDKTVVMNVQVNNERIECQIRDFALVTMLQLLSKNKEALQGTLFEKGDIKAFGFERLEANAAQGYASHTVGFTSDAKRKEVFERWEELKAQLPELEEAVLESK
jgi:hypothetical protein